MLSVRNEQWLQLFMMRTKLDIRDIKLRLMSLVLSVLTRTQLMTGQNTSAHLGRSTTTTVELRSPSGRSPKTCWRGKQAHLNVKERFPSSFNHIRIITGCQGEGYVVIVAFCLFCFREQRQKDSVKVPGNSFPRDMDYRQEALQDKAPSSKYSACLIKTSSERSLTLLHLNLFTSSSLQRLQGISLQHPTPAIPPLPHPLRA